jgi:hypothetical protein
MTTPDDIALVASYTDLRAARRLRFRRFILAQHGAGQSYGGDPRSARNPAYPGGSDNGDVGLFLVPNDHAASRWQDAYPHAAVRVVGSPRLDTLPTREPGAGPVVAVSFHWDPFFSPEAGSAYAHFARALPALADRYRVIGHGHPRRHDLPKVYRRLGIDHVPDFDDVCRMADLYVCDNSSTLFEFAATGRPVVVLDSPRYRRDIDHGLRFWEASSIGLRVATADHLMETVAVSLMPSHAAELRYCREAALDLVYAYRDHAADRAAEAIREWVA